CVVWRDTVKPAGWECPIYWEWLAAIRAVNLKLPEDKRLRVLAGDLPVDWAKIKTAEDYAALGMGGRGAGNDVSFAKVVNDQLAQKRKVLLVIGLGHCARNGDRRRAENHNTFTRIDKEHPGKACVLHLFTASSMVNRNDVQTKLAAWKKPALCFPLK